MKKSYVLSQDLWLDGILRTKGSTVELTDSAAKYLKHALVVPAAKVELAEAVEVKPAPKKA